MRTLNETIIMKMQEYILSFQKENGKSPSYRQIQNSLGMSSLNLVQRYVLELERTGQIERTRLGSITTIPRLRSNGITMTPLVGEIVCGQPVDSVENIEENFALPKALFGSGELFMLRTYGNSMIEIGIKENDLVVCRKQNYAENGEIVVALIDGATTLKRFFKRNKKIVLHPENKDMEDIILDECEIQGVLISCIKMFS